MHKIQGLNGINCCIVLKHNIASTVKPNWAENKLQDVLHSTKHHCKGIEWNLKIRW